ncbi:hypothetical protein ml_192 [Mollivirus sibericum]|uniref:hypothetical protein n=1 Tax=Mollivirus sibericum TaxID=1678078 RepID=UPI0006B2DE39|nr:hypothetical protein ml_192 [Mollivirus sibericum]ALD61994.1 hypothetical protein ml_192 [Mollivirus sibericum]
MQLAQPSIRSSEDNHGDGDGGQSRKRPHEADVEDTVKRVCPSDDDDDDNGAKTRPTFKVSIDSLDGTRREFAMADLHGDSDQDQATSAAMGTLDQADRLLRFFVDHVRNFERNMCRDHDTFAPVQDVEAAIQRAIDAKLGADADPIGSDVTYRLHQVVKCGEELRRALVKALREAIRDSDGRALNRWLGLFRRAHGETVAMDSRLALRLLRRWHHRVQICSSAAPFARFSPSDVWLSISDLVLVAHDTLSPIAFAVVDCALLARSAASTKEEIETCDFVYLAPPDSLVHYLRLLHRLSLLDPQRVDATLYSDDQPAAYADAVKEMFGEHVLRSCLTEAAVHPRLCENLTQRIEHVLDGAIRLLLGTLLLVRDKDTPVHRRVSKMLCDITSTTRAVYDVVDAFVDDHEDLDVSSRKHLYQLPLSLARRTLRTFLEQRNKLMLSVDPHTGQLRRLANDSAPVAVEFIDALVLLHCSAFVERVTFCECDLETRQCWKNNTAMAGGSGGDSNNDDEQELITDGFLDGQDRAWGRGEGYPFAAQPGAKFEDIRCSDPAFVGAPSVFVGDADSYERTHAFALMNRLQAKRVLRGWLDAIVSRRSHRPSPVTDVV